jgi:hypothetical protein
VKLVYVEWVDSAAMTGTWNDLSTVRGKPQPFVCRSVGWVVSESRDYLQIAAHLAGEPSAEPHQAGGDMSIPKAAITRRRTLVQP